MAVKARYSAMWPAKPTNVRFTGRRTMRIAPVGLLGRFARLAEADDVHLVSRLDQGVALAANPRVAGIHGVDRDRHSPRRRVTRP